MINAKTVQDQVAVASSTSQWRLVWRGFRKRRLGMAGLIVLFLLVLAVIFVPIFHPNPYESGPIADNTLWNAPIGRVDPSNGHVYILGGDAYGRDNFSLLFQAGRLTLLVAFVPAVLVLFIGSVIGAVAGYYGGGLDIAFMRTADFLIALPLLPAYVISIRIIGSGSQQSSISDQVWPTAFTLIAVFVLFGWMGISRLVRSLALSLREQSFVEAARALGASNRRIIFRHLIPNMVGPLIVACMFAIGDFVIMEAILAYFGLSFHDNLVPSTVSWGNMLASNQSWMYLVTNFNPFHDIRLYLMVFPSVLILITVLCVNFIGDALRDVLDPRLHV
jgi:peptide/nickel transport system permease protein